MLEKTTNSTAEIGVVGTVCVLQPEPPRVPSDVPPVPRPPVPGRPPVAPPKPRPNPPYDYYYSEVTRDGEVLCWHVIDWGSMFANLIYQPNTDKIPISCGDMPP